MLKILLFGFLIQSWQCLIDGDQNECTFTVEEEYFEDVPISYTEKVIKQSICTYSSTIFVYRKIKTRICAEESIQTNIRYEKQRKIKQSERKKCCDGYVLVHGVCEPHCDNYCVNGQCTAPNFCTCNYGYEKKSQYNCIPWQGYMSTPSFVELNNYTPKSCDNCSNGICRDLKSCECNENFRKAFDSNGLFIGCDPICDFPCINGNCISNSTGNICQCLAGYKEGFMNRCEAICEPPCDNGFCVRPNTCECNEGYYLGIGNSSYCVANSSEFTRHIKLKSVLYWIIVVMTTCLISV